MDGCLVVWCGRCREERLVSCELSELSPTCDRVARGALRAKLWRPLPERRGSGSPALRRSGSRSQRSGCAGATAPAPWLRQRFPRWFREAKYTCPTKFTRDFLQTSALGCARGACQVSAVNLVGRGTNGGREAGEPEPRAGEPESRCRIDEICRSGAPARSHGAGATP